MRARSGILIVAIALWVVPGSALAGGVLLYDVDFGTPPHTPGEPPVTGTGPAPRETPTQIVFGEPLVVAALGALDDQPCAFGWHASDPYDQLKFATGLGGDGFPEAYDSYHIEMDLIVEASAASFTFTILLDTPTVRNIYFYDDGQIRAWPCPGEYIGTYEYGVPLFLEIDLDVANDQLTITKDSDVLWSGDCEIEVLRAIRLNMDQTTDAPDPVAVDNFRVYGGGGPSECVGDIDGDGDTDHSDLGELLAAWCTHEGDPNWNPNADLDGDGHVGHGDLGILLADWGCTP